MTTSAVLLMSFLTGTDILLKQHIEENYDSVQEKETAGGRIILRKVYNKGFALHVLDNRPHLIKAVSSVLGAVILFCDIQLFLSKGHSARKLGMAVFSAGAFSNIFDRLVRGKVIDYIGFKSSNRFFSQLTVNLADIFLITGLVLLVPAKMVGKRR